MAETSNDTASLEKQDADTDIGTMREQQISPPDLQPKSDPDRPRDWSRRKKWSAVATASAFGFITPIASSMLAPALPAIGEDLAISNKSELQMVLSIFILAYAIGPLLLGPLSEAYGRVWVLQSASTMFMVFNLACGFAQNYSQILAFRFLAGIGGSGPQSIGVGILADCFATEDRGAALRMYTLPVLFAPALGPIIMGFIVARTTWRWMFWALSIAMVVVQICAIFFLAESWEPRVLAIGAKKLRHSSGEKSTGAESRPTAIAKHLGENLIRATKMLLTQPIIIVVAVYMAYLFGLTYLMLSTFAELYTSPDYYDQSIEHGSLHYITLALGYVFGTQITSYLDDVLFKRFRLRYSGNETPELRLPAMLPATILLPAGLLMYGWCAQAKTHWILPDIGAFLISAAIMSGYYCIQRYTVDTYTKYAASALSATITLRSIAGFAFPLFAPAMYDALHYGWGNSILAFIAIALGIPAPFLFWFYGAKLRAVSRYAAG